MTMMLLSRDRDLGPADGAGIGPGEDGIILSTLAFLIPPTSNPKTEQENPTLPQQHKAHTRK